MQRGVGREGSGPVPRHRKTDLDAGLILERLDQALAEGRDQAELDGGLTAEPIEKVADVVEGVADRALEQSHLALDAGPAELLLLEVLHLQEHARQGLGDTVVQLPSDL